jgi:hypothetical protein
MERAVERGLERRQAEKLPTLIEAVAMDMWDP